MTFSQPMGIALSLAICASLLTNRVMATEAGSKIESASIPFHLKESNKVKFWGITIKQEGNSISIYGRLEMRGLSPNGACGYVIVHALDRNGSELSSVSLAISKPYVTQRNYPHFYGHIPLENVEKIELEFHEQKGK